MSVHTTLSGQREQQRFRVVQTVLPLYPTRQPAKAAPRLGLPHALQTRAKWLCVKRAMFPLEVAVIPFGEVGINHRHGLQPSQGAGLQCTKQRTGENVGKGDALQSFPEYAGCFLAVRAQRDVRASRVLSGERPIGVAMPNDVNTESLRSAHRRHGSPHGGPPDCSGCDAARRFGRRPLAWLGQPRSPALAAEWRGQRRRPAPKAGVI